MFRTDINLIDDSNKCMSHRFSTVLATGTKVLFEHSLDNQVRYAMPQDRRNMVGYTVILEADKGVSINVYV